MEKQKEQVYDWVSSKKQGAELRRIESYWALLSLITVDKIMKKIEDIKEYFSIFGDRLPVALSDRAESIKNMLGSV